MTIISIEIQCEGREGKVWHHKLDKINSIFCCIHDENAFINYTNNNCIDPNFRENYNNYSFLITTNKKKNFCKKINKHYILSPEYLGYSNDNFKNSEIVEVFQVADEILLFKKFIEMFSCYDPDIVIGYETEMLSIAYILRRADFLGIKIYKYLSRENFTEDFDEERIRLDLIQRNLVNKNLNDKEDKYYDDPKKIKYLEQKFGKIIKLKGRIIINLWRVLSHELKLIDYSLENVVFHVLKIREPRFNNQILQEFYNSNKSNYILFCLNYYMKRAKYNLQMIDELDLITREVQFTRSKKKIFLF